MCPKVSSYATKTFDRILGGFFVLSFAGGVGLYSLHSWMMNIQFKMKSISQYTFSGRTSCMLMRDLGGYKREKGGDIPKDCLAKIVEQQLNLDNDNIDDVEHIEEINNEEFIAEGTIEGAIGTRLLMNYPQATDEQKEQEEEPDLSMLLPVELQRQTSPSLFDLLPFLFGLDADGSAESRDIKQHSDTDTGTDTEEESSQHVDRVGSSDLNLFGVYEDDTLCLHQQLKLYLEQYLLEE